MILLEFIVGISLVVGAGFSLVAAIGLLRLPDLYMRMHADSKAGTLGSGLMLLALAIFSVELAVVTRALAGIVFFLLTAPVSAHLLAKAAYTAGYEPSPMTSVDALKDIQSSGKSSEK